MDRDTQAQPQTSSVIFRRQQSQIPAVDSSSPSSPVAAKPKPHPPPKPASLTRSTPAVLKGVVPHGTVKAISKDLEKQLVLVTPRSVAAESTSTGQISATSTSPAEHFIRLGANNYEIVHGPPRQLFREKASTTVGRKRDEVAASTDGLAVDEPEYDLVYEDQFDDDWDAPTPPEPVQEDPDTYATNVELRRPWLMDGHPSRQQAAQALKGKPEGAFVIRRRCGQDSHIFPYALAVIYKDRPVHMQIQRTEDYGLVLAPWKVGEKPFATLDELVQYYRDNRLAFVQNSLQGFVSLQKGNFLYD